jgi:5-oxoprolinase (ATP-hydrolysing) subunit A
MLSGDPRVIDLNCDMGEGMETDALIFPFISSANIACGGHAGDPDSMRRSVELALQHNVAIGAHPSYPDRAQFGRADILGASLRQEDLPGILSDQLSLLQTVCQEFGVRMHHVKPHGALYNRAARDAELSALICGVVSDFDPTLLVFGLSGSLMAAAAHAAGLGFVNEVFADRTYRADGSLTPRTEPGALIEDPELAVAQALKLVREGRVEVETICLHGDGSHAVEFARLIYEAMKAEGIRIAAPVQRG